MRAARMVIMVMGIALGACAAPETKNFVFTPPGTAEGKACVESCKDTLNACTALEERAYQSCLKDRKFDTRIYENCAHARDPFEQGICRQPALCPAPNFARCEGEYRACFVACGGRVKPAS